MIIEIKDYDTVEAVRALEELNINFKIRDDREVSWIGDSLLQALFDITEVGDDVRDDLIMNIPKMAAEIDWMLYEGGSAKLTLIDGLRKEFFYNYLRRRIQEISKENGVVSIFTRL
ncbi:hypothetical protein ACHAL6_11635 [Proteiniclasticum sp. C24MP]|uniref:hypothetical protein n=1 Tax=Proteiniclasticum sp. C24MP TaxID=3374101 RepID=UPI0037546DC3